ncbi:MAG TPA: MFS transporter [Acidimicrobiia bacterium]|nr:MFS transporter [Acidimicrobiia bacterium]
MIGLLRRNADFRALFFAQIVSFCGDWFATVAMLGLVIDRTGSDVAAAAVFVVQTLPGFLLSPFAGPAADRLDRRTLMLGVSLLQAAAAGLFLVALHGPVVFAFVGQGLISALGAFFAPASQAALPNLVDADDLKLATTMMSSTWGAMLAVGAAVGGAFTVAFGREAAFVADGASFLLAAALIASIRRPTQEAAAERPRGRMRPLSDSVETFRFARSHPLVAALLSSKLGFGLASGTMGMLALLANGPFKSSGLDPDAGTGLLLGARGLGVLAGPFVANRLLTRREDRAVMSGILLTCGAAGLVYAAGYVVVGTAPTIGVAVVGGLVAHLGGGAQWALSTYGLQSAVPDYIRGRVFAADFALVTVTMSLSLTLAGALAEVTGPRLPTLLLAAVAFLWGCVYLTLTRPLRQAEAEQARSSSAASRS